MLGYEAWGAGANAVLVLNDWMCDTSTWEHARSYLDQSKFTWVFTDLRGYGRSRGQDGAFDLRECAADVLAVADALGHRRFAVVGHSLSALVALHLAQHDPARIERAVLLTPPPPRGFGASDAALDSMRTLALGDDAQRLAGLRPRWAGRRSEGWIAFKARRWRETADPRAAAAYVAMFGRDGLPDPTTKIAVPVLAVTGEQDAETMRRATIAPLLAPLCSQLEVRALGECGHYPMQEMPPLLVAIVEQFLAPVAP